MQDFMILLVAFAERGIITMKKVIGCFFAALLSVSIMGCSGSGKTEKEKQPNYVVVEMSNGTKVDDLFEFESVTEIALDGRLVGVEDGVYCSGALQDGNSVIWRSDDDGYGYDDSLFVYVEDEISAMQISGYAFKLKETPISYNSFKEKYQ